MSFFHIRSAAFPDVLLKTASHDIDQSMLGQYFLIINEEGIHPPVFAYLCDIKHVTMLRSGSKDQSVNCQFSFTQTSYSEVTTHTYVTNICLPWQRNLVQTKIQTPTIRKTHTTTHHEEEAAVIKEQYCVQMYVCAKRHAAHVLR